MNKIELTIKRAIVIESSTGIDTVCVFIDGLTNPMPTYPNDEISLDFKVQAGYGVAWVKDNFGIEPEVIKRPYL